MERKRRLGTDWKMACLFLAILGTAILVVALRRDPAPYKFLEGHKSVSTITKSYSPTSLWESRRYEFDHAFDDVVDEMREELAPKGFKITIYDQVGEFISPRGELIMATRLAGGKKGCEVNIAHEIPDNWLTKLRQLFTK